MTRRTRDLICRDAGGNWISRYSEPLSQKTIGVKLFESDQLILKKMSQEIDATPTEIVREIVRLWLADAKTDALKILNKALPPKPL